MTARAIESALRAAGRPGPAIIPYVTAGFPTLDALPGLLNTVAPHAAVIEIGVPFSDPMADGVTIQRSSRIALENGATIGWLLDLLGSLRRRPAAPLVLMSYLNPLLSLGDSLGRACGAAGVSGVVVPDLPLEESRQIRSELNASGLGLIQLVAPVTDAARGEQICRASDGFVYAVTVTGTTGSAAPGAGAGVAGAGLAAYLDRLRRVSPVPVCAGFGISTREQVRALRGHADGVIIGSALIEAITRGRDPGATLADLSG